MALTRVSYNLINGPHVNVADYGADPTGVADSTNAIQAAISAVIDTGGTVLFNKGTYKVTGTLMKYHSRVTDISRLTLDLGGSTISHEPTVDGTDLFDLRILASASGDTDNTVGSSLYYDLSIVNGKLLGSPNSRFGIYGINLYRGYFNVDIEDFNTQRTGGTTSAAIKLGGYQCSGGVAISGSYRGANDQGNHLSCTTFNCAIGIIAYDSSATHERSRIQNCSVANIYFSGGGFSKIKDCFVYNTGVSRTVAGMIIFNGSGGSEVSGNYIYSSGAKDIGIRLCQAANLIAPHVIEPAGATTYVRAVSIHNNTFQERNEADTSCLYPFIYITDEAALAVENCSIADNVFVMANNTAKPFGTNNDYTGNVPIVIPTATAARAVHYSHNQVDGLPGNSTTVNDCAIFKTSLEPAGISSDDWEIVYTDFMYSRVGTGNLGAQYLNYLNGPNVYLAQDNLMFMGCDLYLSERASAAFTTTFLNLFIDGVEQNTTGSALFPRINLNNDGRKYTESGTYLGTTYRCSPYITQTGGIDPAMDDKFIIAAKGQKIQVRINAIDTNFVSASGADFYITCRVYWYNRTATKQVNGI